MTGALHSASLSDWRAVSASGDRSIVRFSSFSLVSGDEPPVVRTQHQKTPQPVFVSRSWPAFLTASSPSGSVVTPEGETVWPRFRTFFRNN